MELSRVLSCSRVLKPARSCLGGVAAFERSKLVMLLHATGSCRARHIYKSSLINSFSIFQKISHLLLLTESMSSMVSANSGMVCREESTVLASTARNLLGETGSCVRGPCGISGPLQGSLSPCSSRLLLLVANVSLETPSDQAGYGSMLWRRRKKKNCGEMLVCSSSKCW